MEGQWFLYPSPDTLYGFSFIWLSFSLAYIASYTFLCSVYWLHRLYLHWPDGARPGTWFPFCVLLLWIHISSASVQAVKGHLGSNSLWHRNHFPWRSIQPVCSTSLITAATLSFSAFSLDQLQLPLASPLSKLGHPLSSLINRTHVLSPLFLLLGPCPRSWQCPMSGHHSPGLEECQQVGCSCLHCFYGVKFLLLCLLSVGKGSVSSVSSSAERWATPETG